MVLRDFLLVIICFSSLIISGCGGGGSSTSPEDAELYALAASHGLTGDASSGRTLSSIETPLAQLGMFLFFSKALGGEHDSACVSCHHPALGGGDDLSLSRGVGAVEPDHLGAGRVLGDESSGPNVPRNAPTTFNIGLWDSVLFWDGRVESLGKTALSNGSDSSGLRTPDTDAGVKDPLAGTNLPTAQARFPVTSAEEMRGDFVSSLANEGLRTALADRLAGNSAWQDLFQGVFGDQRVSFDRIAAAIAEYERSQVFVNSSWQAFLMGDSGAISRSAKRGGLLFFRAISEGGANCAACHSGDFFTDEKFHNIAVPQIGRGKGDGINGDNDFGRFRETDAESDRFAFRTPALLNVEVTGPYGHSGAYTTLEGVIRHHLNPSGALLSYDTAQLESTILTENVVANTELALAALEAARAGGRSPVLEDVVLSDQEVADLVEFMKSLTDPCVKDSSCLQPWIPVRGDDPEGLLQILFAMDNSGSSL